MGPRRDNGQGSIRWNDRDGRWHGKVHLGKQRRYLAVRPDSLSEKDIARAKRRLQADIKTLVTQHEAGIRRDPDVSTVGHWLRLWLDTIAARAVRPRTWERYDSVARCHLIPALGDIPLDKLEPEDCEALYLAMEDKGLSGGSVLYAHSVLRRALNVAVQRRRIIRNPCLLVDSPRAKSRKVPPLTLEEAQLVIATTQSRPNAARWLLGLSLGLRQSEILGLTWDSVDLDTGLLQIRQGLHRYKGRGLNLAEVKSTAGQRTLALDADLVRALREHRRRQSEDRLAAGSVWANDLGLVFTQVDGRPFDRAQDWTAWRDLLAEIGIPHRGTHSARHTAASLLAKCGVSHAEAKDILGHSRVSLTIDVYTHVDAEQNRAALEKVAGRLLRPGATAALLTADEVPR